MLFLIFLLIVCHYIGDFTGLNTPLFPIFLHACVYGILMMIILLFFVAIVIFF